jgi:phosphoglycolate phosphatase
MKKRKKMTPHLLIFDFDGTIADTLDHLVKIGNQLSREFHYKKVRSSQIEEFKDRSLREIIRTLEVPLSKIPRILMRARKELHKNISRIKPIKGLKDILLELKSLGYRMGIITSNSSDNVKNFLKNHNLEMFEFVKTSSKLWSKNHILRRVIRKNGFSIDQIIYIGDEVRDIEAAQKAGVLCMAVTWGFNSKRALKACRPDYLAHKPEDLIKKF